MPITDTAETGRQLAVRLQKAYPQQDWMAALAERAGDSRETVEWHLQEDMRLPERIADAAEGMLAESRPSSQPGTSSEGLMTSDDLPFAGVPETIGKLHKD